MMSPTLIDCYALIPGGRGRAARLVEDARLPDLCCALMLVDSMSSWSPIMEETMSCAEKCEQPEPSAVAVCRRKSVQEEITTTAVMHCETSNGRRCCELCRSINANSLTYSTLSRTSYDTIRSNDKVVPPSDTSTLIDGTTSGDHCSAQETRSRYGTISLQRYVSVSPAYADHRKILIEREKCATGVVQFQELFPSECFLLKGLVFSEDDWFKFMNGLNRRCRAMRTVDNRQKIFVGLSCCCFLDADIEHYKQKVTRYTEKYNKEFFIPRGYLIIDPAETDYNVLELVVLGERLPRTVMVLSLNGERSLPVILDESHSTSGSKC
ncbi:unnamed protein product [Toxocara canis]|uniref:SPOC domain-containing protein n=1 Tax=Toxocara canis TaxID=6265 RepID=A0A183URB6_TOXCA|nr:unnamed protein product [Toxocara canis]